MDLLLTIFSPSLHTPAPIGSSYVLPKTEEAEKMATKDRHGIIRVQVTDADIGKAEKANSMKCVVAQAIARTIPNATRIDVDVQTIRWTQDGERMIFLTPYSVSGYVVAFDAGDKIEPFGFGLDSRRRVPVRQTKATTAGKEIVKATSRAKRTKKKIDHLELVASGKTLPPPTTAERAVAKEKVEDAKVKLSVEEQAVSAVRAAYADAVQKETVSEGRSAPKRVVKSSERHYGQRKLRINQS